MQLEDIGVIALIIGLFLVGPIMILSRSHNQNAQDSEYQTSMHSILTTPTPTGIPTQQTTQPSPQPAETFVQQPTVIGNQSCDTADIGAPAESPYTQPAPAPTTIKACEFPWVCG